MNELDLEENEVVDFSRAEKLWMRILEKDENYDKKQLMQNYYKLNNGIIYFFRYRNYLLEQHKDISKDEIEELMQVLSKKDSEIINIKFTEIFLEPFSDDDINIILKYINNKNKLEKLIGLHNLKKTYRLMYILTLI